MKKATAAVLLLLGALMISGTAVADLSTGLVAYWSFDDCTAKDSSGNGYDGSIIGSPQCVDGAKGKAFSFNGNSINISESLKTNYFSFSGWFKTSSTGGDYNGNMIIRLRYWGYSITVDYGRLGAWVAKSNSDGYYFSPEKSVADDKYHHVALSYDAATGYNLYLDGVLISHQNTGNNPPVYFTSGGGYSFGKDGNYPGHYFKGILDEFRLYNRALTAPEVMALYQQGATQITSITPIVAVLDKPTIFTVTGKNLTSNMGFTIADCDASNVEIGTGSSTKRRFKCTPRGTAGQKPGIIKTQPGGQRLYNFDVKIQPNATPPIIVDVNPKTAVLNKRTQFTVTGGNLTSGMGFTIADCDASNTEVLKATPLSRTFVCTPRGTIGRKVGIVKTAPGGLSTHYFDVVVKANATDTVTNTLLGKISYNANVKSVAVSALLSITDTNVTFKPTMQPVVSSWIAGTTVFKIGSVIRRVRQIYPPNADGSVVIDTSAVEQADFFKSVSLSASSVALTTDNLAGGISENTTPSLQITARSSQPSLKSIEIQNTRDVFQFIFTNHVLYDADNSTATKIDQLILNGSLLIEKPVVTFSYVSSYYPTPQATANVTFKAKEAFDLKYSSQEISFRANKSFPLGTFIVPIPASGGTVYGKLVLFLMFDANGKAQIVATFTQSVTVDLGYTAKLNGLSFSFASKNKSAEVAPNFTTAVTGEVNAKLSLNAALAIIAFNYDLTGVNAIAGPTMNVSASVLNGSPCFNFSVSASATASAYLMMPEVTIPPGYFGWLDTEARMVKRTKLLFDKSLSKVPYALNGCAP